MTIKTGGSAMQYAVSLLSRRDYSRAMLTEKLTRKGYPSDEISMVTDQLIRWKYLDDFRYAQRYIATYRKKYGNAYLQRKLHFQGVSPDIINQVLEQNPTAEQREAALQLALRKISRDQTRNLEFSELQQKLYCMLIRKGYEYDDVYYVLNQISGKLYLES